MKFQVNVLMLALLSLTSCSSPVKRSVASDLESIDYIGCYVLVGEEKILCIDNADEDREGGNDGLPVDAGEGGDDGLPGRLTTNVFFIIPTVKPMQVSQCTKSSISFASDDDLYEFQDNNGIFMKFSQINPDRKNHLTSAMLTINNKTYKIQSLIAASRQQYLGAAYSNNICKRLKYGETKKF